MPSYIPLLVYSVVGLLSIGLLYWFGAKAWYWHVLSFAAASGLAFIHVPERIAGPIADLVVGAVFFFLMLWALLAPFFRVHRRHARHA